MVVRRKTCSLCEAQCGLLIDVEGDQVRSIRGDPDDVLSRGYLCPKAVALQDLHADPDRLRQPMVREGERWREIGWDEAYDQVADRLAAVVAEHGREALGLYLGNPNVHNYAALLAIPTFTRALQSKSRFSATSVDQLPHMFAALQMFGHQLALPVPDLARTEHLVILGANPVVSNGSLMTAPDMRRRLKAIGDRGGKVVVLDPRRTETADLADQHAFVRPGTDTVLLLAWLRVMFDEDLVDDGPWRAHARGLERIAEVAQLTTPEEAAPVVGLAVDEIRAMVRAFCAAPSAVMILGAARSSSSWTRASSRAVQSAAPSRPSIPSTKQTRGRRIAWQPFAMASAPPSTTVRASSLTPARARAAAAPPSPMTTKSTASGLGTGRSRRSYSKGGCSPVRRSGRPMRSIVRSANLRHISKAA